MAVNTRDSERIDDPLLKAVRDARPRGIPHRIIPSLARLGTYKGYEEPQKATGLTYEILRAMANTHVVRAVIARHARGDHRGAYREYCARMGRLPGSPPVCSWLDFAAWWRRREEEMARG